jgi:hypothetical protein
MTISTNTCTGNAKHINVQWNVYSLTTACDVEDESLSLSNERDVNSGGRKDSVDFLP